MSDANKPTNQADGNTDKAGNDEHQQKRVRGDTLNEITDPANSRRDERRNIRENFSQKITPIL